MFDLFCREDVVAHVRVYFSMFDQAYQALKDEMAFYCTFLDCSEDDMIGKIQNSKDVPMTFAAEDVLKTTHQSLLDVKVTQTEHQIAMAFLKDSKEDLPGKISTRLGECLKSEEACPEKYREGHRWDDLAHPRMRADVEKILGAVRKAAASKT